MIKKCVLYSFFTSIIFLMTPATDSARAADKYDEAIDLCRDYSEKRANKLYKYAIKTSDVYEEAMKICGVSDYRRYAPTVWGMYVFGEVASNYKTLVNIKLHHIAGDMIHIVRLAKDPKYREKVASAMAQEYVEIWAENNAPKSTQGMWEITVPQMPSEYRNNDIDMCDAFIKMIGFFKRWNELIMEEGNIRSFYSSILNGYDKGGRRSTSEPDYYSYEPYDQISLAKYRAQRKLSLFWHPRDFFISDTRVYKEAAKRERDEGFRNAICQPPINTVPYVSRCPHGNKHGTCDDTVCKITGRFG